MHTYETYTNENQQEVPVLGVVSLWFGAGLVGITAVASILSFQSGSVSGAIEVVETFRVVLFALLLASIVYLMWRAGSGSLFLAAMPLLINLFTLIIIQFVPFAVIWEEMSFQMNSSRYHKVVELVETGQLPLAADGSAALPLSYRDLSQSGRIYVEKQNGATNVLFISSRQTGSGVEGFLYRSDGLPPHDEFGGNWRYLAEKRPFWFYCAR